MIMLMLMLKMNYQSPDMKNNNNNNRIYEKKGKIHCPLLFFKNFFLSLGYCFEFRTTTTKNKVEKINFKPKMPGMIMMKFYFIFQIYIQAVNLFLISFFAFQFLEYCNQIENKISKMLSFSNKNLNKYHIFFDC